MSPIPVTILTGFLGAGKTSLLNALFRDPAFAETAVLINEFGDVQIDHDLVAHFSPDLVTTTTGCLCCTASSDLKQSLFELWTRRKNREIGPFRRVLVETTGLVDPVPVVNTLLAPPLNTTIDRIVSTQFALARVVTLLDVVNAHATLAREQEALKQIALADAVVLTKTDLLQKADVAAAIAAAKARVADINPAAAFFVRGDDDTAVRALFLSSGTYDLRTKGEDAVGWLKAEAVLAAHASPGAGHPHAHGHHDPAHGHDHVHGHHHHDHGHHHHDHDHPHAHGEHEHAHGDHGHHDDGIRSHVLTLDAPIHPLVFSLFLDHLRAVAGADLLRVKGLVALSTQPEAPVVVHGVQHLVHPIDTLEKWPSDDRRTRIVVIGRNLDIEAMRRVLTSARRRPSASASSP